MTLEDCFVGVVTLLSSTSGGVKEAVISFPASEDMEEEFAFPISFTILLDTFVHSLCFDVEKILLQNGEEDSVGVWE